MKFCKDCKWFQHISVMCIRPTGIELIYGEKTYLFNYAIDERKDTGSCGTLAQYWESKE